VSDTSKFEAATGWRPKTSVEEGVGRLLEWLLESGARTPRDVVGGRVA
jgi:nucleoside-diphosphate-sugar epimerase